MASPYLGEIRLASFNFPPKGWAFCAGQLLPINQNQALFSLLGTYYGGNGQTTFALPDLRGRVALSAGQGAGLQNRVLGEEAGEEAHTLSGSELPSHNHPLMASTVVGTTTSPAGALLAAPNANARANTLYAAGAASSALNPAAISSVGGSQPHSNIQPVLALSYIIALQGIFPSRP